MKLKGFIVRFGHAGCLPDSYEYFERIDTTESTIRQAHRDGLDGTDYDTAQAFAEANNLTTLEEVLESLN